MSKIVGTKDKEEFLNLVLSKIDRRIALGKSTLAMIKLDIEDNTAKYVEKYIKEKTNHIIEITRCTNCKGLWDIFIWIKK